MPFPTATVTQGSGLTINTLPNAGQATMTNSLPVVIASDQGPFSVTSLTTGAATNPTSILTRFANTTAYAANQLIGTNTNGTLCTVPFFVIANSGGAAIISRLSLRTNVLTGWANVNLSVNLWRAAPTYLAANGDGGPYLPNTGSASWIGNFLIPSLLQFGDGAVSGGGLTSANETVIKLSSGGSIFWDLQILSVATPITGQTFTLTAELLN